MKRTCMAFVFLFLGFAINGFSQTATTNDFFLGKWEVLVVGTPDGDSKLVTELTREDGKLTGELKDPTGKNPNALPISNIMEEGNKMTIFFEAQGTEVSLDLAKVDDDHLKGSVMNGMFDATAVRIKE
ncbi:hypothetical protein [Dyadobacter alkalitolerans]|uniref:hypothetical protein n=1 Tax=Dyadobacter alkalitolerans TaxID=492736 RepID=UPI00047E25FE|nr:hypothetical protein [Dyadobacter alkalitolerans]